MIFRQFHERTRHAAYPQYFRDRPAFYLKNARIAYKQHITLKSNKIQQVFIMITVHTLPNN